MDKTKETILQEKYSEFIINEGFSSNSTKEFPFVYKKPVLLAMDEFAKQEALAFAYFTIGCNVAGITLDKIWENFKDKTYNF